MIKSDMLFATEKLFPQFLPILPIGKYIKYNIVQKIHVDWKLEPEKSGPNGRSSIIRASMLAFFHFRFLSFTQNILYYTYIFEKFIKHRKHVLYVYFGIKSIMKVFFFLSC